MTTTPTGPDPETITSEGELDALPMRSVIRDRWDTLAERSAEGWGFASGRGIASGHVALPVTVLHRPDRHPLATVQASADAWWQEYSDEADAHAKLRSGIETLADEWEAEVGKVGRDLSMWDGGYEAAMSAAAARLRALLSSDDEPEVSA